MSYINTNYKYNYTNNNKKITKKTYQIIALISTLLIVLGFGLGYFVGDLTNRTSNTNCVTSSLVKSRRNTQNTTVVISNNENIYFAKSSFTMPIQNMPGPNDKLAYLSYDNSIFISCNVENGVAWFSVNYKETSYTIVKYSYGGSYEWTTELDNHAVENDYLRSITCSSLINNSSSYSNPKSFNVFNFLSNTRTYSLNIDPTILVGVSNDYANGVADGKQYVINTPNLYNLYSPVAYNDYGTAEYNRGYNEGIAYQVQQNTTVGFTFASLTNTILNAPYNILHDIFNFTDPVFNINWFTVVSFVITFGILIWFVKLLLGKK